MKGACLTSFRVTLVPSFLVKCSLDVDRKTGYGGSCDALSLREFAPNDSHLSVPTAASILFFCSRCDLFGRLPGESTGGILPLAWLKDKLIWHRN